MKLTKSTRKGGDNDDEDSDLDDGITREKMGGFSVSNEATQVRAAELDFVLQNRMC